MNFSGLQRGALLLLACAAAVLAQPYQVSAHYTKHEYQIPMRDGTRLFTAVYQPNDQTKNYPVLMTRTPYGVAPYGESNYPEMLGPSTRFDADGFIYVFQDVRGRYMSEGVWQEMTPEQDRHSGKATDESTDCYDTVEWLLKNLRNQNGKVGLIGISYPGFYTATGMIDAHPAVVAASPQAPVTDLFMGDDAYHNGALYLLANFDFYTSFTEQHGPRFPDSDSDFPYGTKDGYRFFLHMGTVAASEKYFHHGNRYWTETYSHDTYDEYWQRRSILPHLRDIRPAVLLVGGWLDAEDLSGTLKMYRALRTQSPGTKVTFVMGPWSHGGWEDRNEARLGDISFGGAPGAFFQDEIELPFFRHYLKDEPDPHLAPTYTFRTGDNVWTRGAAWAPETAAPCRFYLHSNHALDRVAGTGTGGWDEYVSDPARPVPFFGKPTLHMNREFMNADQRFAAARPDVLWYETDPLDRDLILQGPVGVSLQVATSGTDSDFDVKLIDVHPEVAKGVGGYQELVRGEPFRAKFRKSFSDPKAMAPGKREEIRFAMPDIDHCFRKGHRLMVQIQSSWFPLTDRNPQTFTHIPTAKSSQFQVARERVFHDTEAPSYIEMFSEQH